MQLIYDEIMNILDLKCIPTKRTGFSLNPGVYEVVGLNNTLKHFLPDNVKVSVTIDDVRLKSNLKTNQTFEDDDHKPIDFNEETVSFTSQLIKI